VTYCPDRFQESLPDLASGTGAFMETTRFPDGVLLQATEHLRDFAGEPVRAVRDALTPALRPRAAKQPRQAGPRMRKRHLRIAWDDGSNGPLAHRPTRAEILEFQESARAQHRPDQWPSCAGLRETSLADNVRTSAVPCFHYLRHESESLHPRQAAGSAPALGFARARAAAPP
jgi:hypothetical protein